MRRPTALLLLLAAALGAGGSSLAAQSIASGAVSGRVQRATGGALSGPVVWLRSQDSGLERSVTTDTEGRFRIDLVDPGPYLLHVEAVGYVPAVIGPFPVEAGRTRHLVATLRAASGPVTSVDSLAAPGRGTDRWRAAETTVPADLLQSLPRSREYLTDLLRQAGAAGPRAMDGLAAGEAAVFYDGVPLPRAPHPFAPALGAWTSLLAPAALDGATLATVPGDIEFGGGGGSGPVVALSSARGVPGGSGFSLRGLASPGAVWQSGRFDGPSDLTPSFWGAARLSGSLKQDTSRMVVSGEFLRRAQPVPARLTAAAAEEITGLGPGIREALASPSVALTTRASGTARLDWWLGPTSRFTLLAGAGRLQRQVDGGDPGLVPPSLLPEEATDFVVTAEVLVERTERLVIEGRAGLSGSSRVFDEAGLRPRARIPSLGIPLGSPEGFPGESKVLGFSASPVAHLLAGPGVVKGGAQVRVARYTMRHSPWEGGSYLFADPAALSMGRGVVLSSSAPEVGFSVSEASGFLQYRWDVAPGMVATFGGRLDVESIPSEASLNATWQEVSGLRNDEFTTSFTQLGAHAGVEWDPTGGGRTLITARADVTHGDIAVGDLGALYSQDGSTTVRRAEGGGMEWPDSPAEGTGRLPVLTLFGPDVRPPRSSRAAVGIRQALSPSWSLFLGASVRRTDFLPRRRDLNLAPAPEATDADGRPVYGDLVADGPLVYARPGSWRRFPDLDAVWAMDPDGWSTRRAVRAGVMYRGDAGTLYAAYTRSHTEDNWVGASRVEPEAQLRPGLPEGRDAWDEGRSDFDVPDVVVAAGTLAFGGAQRRVTLGAVYRWASGRPFTPGYREGVDANGDGSGLNDVAFVPDAAALGEVLTSWPCLSTQVGGFARRNSCRGPARQTLDLRGELALTRVGGRDVRLVVDLLGALESEDGYVDRALLLVDEGGSLTSEGSVVTIPTRVNPDFGRVLIPSSPGRLLRVGISIGGAP